MEMEKTVGGEEQGHCDAMRCGEGEGEGEVQGERVGVGRTASQLEHFLVVSAVSSRAAPHLGQVFLSCSGMASE